MKNSFLGIVAKKVGMTRMVSQDGTVTPVTLLEITSQKVTKMMEPTKDGYAAYQVGYFEKAEKNLNKPDLSRLRKTGINNNFTNFKEFRSSNKAVEGLQVGSELDVSMLEGVSSVDITGVTKGRGFQGAIKRWGSARGRMSHGSCYHRRTGSLGMRATPGRVFKNKKMPGHHGTHNITMQNLTVMNIDKDNRLLAIKGSVPGYSNGFVFVKPSVKGA